MFQLEINWWVIAIVAVVIVAVFTFVVSAVVRSQRRRSITGKEGLLGKVAVVQTALDPTGTVFVEGELWTARSEGGRIERDEEVEITKVDGLRLWVRNKEQGAQ